MSQQNKNLFGNLTWQNYNPKDLLEQNRKKNRIIGLTFPRSDKSLGLEPSILSVLPIGSNVEYCMDNSCFNDNDVLYYACSVYISGYDEFIQWATKHDKNKIIVGGYHPTTFPNEFKQFASKIVRGPCDSFFDTISQDGQIVSGIVNSKHIPRRDLYDIKNNQQIIPDKKTYDISVSINTSMGCSVTPPCDFCASPIMCSKVLSRPIVSIEKELKLMQKIYGIDMPKFCFIRDENFLMQKDWNERLNLIHKHFLFTKIYLFASANTLNEDKIKILKNNNVYMVCLGLEDPTKEYNKNKKLDEIVSLLKKNNIMVYLSFIVNPLEIIGQEAGENFYNVLMNRFQELSPEMICGNFLMPFPGTKLWDKYYAYVDREDYKYYDSKTPFLVRNKILQEKMKFYMFWYQWTYYSSLFYKKNVRNFFVGDTLHLRFMDLKKQFSESYELHWNKRA